MIIERESALQTDGEFGEILLPLAVFGKGTEKREIVIFSQALKEQIGERSGGLADGEARMGAALEQEHRFSEAAKDHAHDGAGETGTDDDEIESLSSHMSSRFEVLRIGKDSYA